MRRIIAQERAGRVDDMVWTTERGHLLRRGSFGRIWRKAVAESVGAPCRVHDLRHTHAAWLIADGEHPKAIQTRLGHGSISVTMDRYGHLMDGLDDEYYVAMLISRIQIMTDQVAA